MSVKKAPAFRLMTNSRKTTAIEMWKSGEFTLETISDKVGTSVRTLSRLFKTLNVKRGSSAAALNAAIADKLAEKAAADAAVTSERIRETRDSGYKILSAIEKLAAHEISEARRLMLPMATTINSMKALKVAADTVVTTWRGRAEILGIANLIPDSDDLPELHITELTDEAIRAMNETSQSTDLDSDIDQIEASLLKTTSGKSPLPEKAVD